MLICMVPSLRWLVLLLGASQEPSRALASPSCVGACPVALSPPCLLGPVPGPSSAPGLRVNRTAWSPGLEPGTTKGGQSQELTALLVLAVASGLPTLLAARQQRHPRRRIVTRAAEIAGNYGATYGQLRSAREPASCGARCSASASASSARAGAARSFATFSRAVSTSTGSERWRWRLRQPLSRSRQRLEQKRALPAAVAGIRRSHPSAAHPRSSLTPAGSHVDAEALARLVPENDERPLWSGRSGLRGWDSNPQPFD